VIYVRPWRPRRATPSSASGGCQATRLAATLAPGAAHQSCFSAVARRARHLVAGCSTGREVVVEQSAALTAQLHDRCAPGMNHVAFAGGQEHDAAYLEDGDGFEVELVAGAGT
jgi:hypothetical protein